MNQVELKKLKESTTNQDENKTNRMFNTSTNLIMLETFQTRGFKLI